MAEVTKTHRLLAVDRLRAHGRKPGELVDWIQAGAGSCGEVSGRITLMELAQLLADREALAYQKGVEAGREPWERLYAAGYVLDRSMPTDSRPGCRLHVNITTGSGSTWTEAARALCIKLGLLKGDAP